MNDIQAGLQILNETITTKSYHPDYPRVTTLASEYYDIFTAQGVVDYIKKYRKSETDEAFQQVIDIYESTIPATVNNLNTLFEKPLRSNRIFATIETPDNAARDEILHAQTGFWQGETESGLDAYLRERWKHLNMYDPNAFIVVEFSAFDPVKEKPQPFAVEYSSAQVRKFSYIKGVLDWLMCETGISYERNQGATKVMVDGSRFILYLDDQAITYTEVDPKDRITDIENPVFVEIRYDDNNQLPDRVFVVETFEMKSLVVPAFRAGYFLDPVTHGRTCVSTIHHALPFFKKELKSGVELDLTIRAHVFPQKYMYGPKCQGNKEQGIPPCMNGQQVNGGKCQACGGTGIDFPVHTTSTDLVIIPIPKAGEQAMDLTKAMAYFSPPLDLVKFMEEYSDRLTERAKAAIFASQVVSATRIGLHSLSSDSPTTATEQDYSWDNVYDTYRPFTAKYSYAWLFITKMIAIYLDNYSESLKLYHKFPSDYKMKGLLELTTDAKAAEDSGLPQYIKKAIQDDIANVVYADDPDTLFKLNVKSLFFPFNGKTDLEIAAILQSPDILPYYKTLYIYFDVIFDMIDTELGDKFYLITIVKQKEEVKTRVDALVAEIAANKQASIATAQKAFQTKTPAIPGTTPLTAAFATAPGA